MLQNHFKVAWRSITRHPTFTIINIIGLSFGISAALMIYLITSFELGYDRFHPDKERIYRIVASEQDNQVGKINVSAGMMPPLPITLKNELTGFDNVAEFSNYYARVTIPQGRNGLKRFDAASMGEAASPIIVAEPSYFAIFPYRWLAGSPEVSLQEPFKVVLSASEARRYFGQIPLEEVIGKDVFYKDTYFDDSLHVTVSGIVQDWDQPSDFAFKDMISAATIAHSFLKNKIHLDHWGNWDPTTQGFVKLSKGVTPAQVEKQFPAFIQNHIPPYPGHTTRLRLQPLGEIHFDSRYRDYYSRQVHLPTLYALMGIAAFILLIAAINFINLSTAQSLQRSTEIGVRKVLGSSKGNLRAQMLTETFVVTLFSVIISIVLVHPLLSLFHSVIPAGVHFDVTPATLTFLVLLTIAVTLLAGSYPAKFLASFLPLTNLQSRGTAKSTQKISLRKTLIVFQFTISLVFIISTLVIRNQIRFIQHKDLGFTKNAIVTLHTAYSEPVAYVSILADRLRQITSVKKVSAHVETPAAFDHWSTHFDRLDRPGVSTAAFYDMCDENYAPLFGLTFVAGRNIAHSDTVREYLINEACAKALGFNKPEQALGEAVQNGMNDAKGTIVGVVKDFNARSLHESITPFFMSSNKNNERTLSIKLSSSDALYDIEKTWKDVYPDEPFEYRWFDDKIAQLYAEEQKTAQLMDTAMVLAIVISCMGLFGLATYTAQQRTKEIGIRKVLGASVSGIVSMLSMDFLKLVMVAIVIASPIAYYCMYHWLEDFAYRITISGWVFVIAGVSAILIALVTVSFQAIRVATANPVKSLRTT